MGRVIGVVLARIQTPEAAATVFGHFDANRNNIIVCRGGEVEEGGEVKEAVVNGWEGRGRREGGEPRRQTQ